MAFYSKNPRNIVNNLKSKVGLWSLMKQSHGTCSYSSCLNTIHLHRFLPLTTLPQFTNPDSISHKKGHFPHFQRFQSTTTEKQIDSVPNGEHSQVLDFPGGKVVFSPEMRFLSESPSVYSQCYRVLDDNGQLISHSNFVPVSEEVAVKMYSNMVTLQTLDTIFYEAQRQGRISFYVTSIGEEAINIASAAALTSDDIVFPQYREPGVLLWRGFTLQEFANQCFGNKADYGKGRQMPIHYGSNKLNYFTVASTIATQIPHAVGAAYSLKMDKKDACAVTYFGDGGTSEGDFHAAMNFAAVTESPVIFICRNNGWAISTPTSDQFRSDGIAVRGQAYGVRSIRVDGNDALAMYSAVHSARHMAVNEHRPILIEAVTYRVGHHSTSDDSTKYRPANEIEWWRMARDPVTRFRKWIEINGWWGSEAESQLRSSIRSQDLSGVHGSGITKLGKQVLNFCCFSKGSFETGNNQRSIDPLEEKLNEREDELFEIDMQKAWMSSTLENARKLADKIKGRIKNPTTEDVGNFMFKTKMYGNRGSSLVDQLHHAPQTVLLVLINS